MKLTFNIKCQFCGNESDNEWYFMPQEMKVMDGMIYSLTRYDLVCKKCNTKHLLELTFKKE
jgi:hypothetical protein